MSTPKNKIMFVGDVHLTQKLYNSATLYQAMFTQFERAVAMAIYEKVKTFVVAGDLFDSNDVSPPAISFVQQQVLRLKHAGITPRAIAGDHDKPVSGDSWVSNCLFESFDPEEDGVWGVDYSDGNDVKHLLDNLPDNTDIVTTLVFHGQTSLLWPFCEEKKLLEFSIPAMKNIFPNLNSIVLGDIHAELETEQQDVNIVYTSSLSPTDQKQWVEKKRSPIVIKEGKEITRRQLSNPVVFKVVDVETASTDPHDYPDGAVFLLNYHKGNTTKVADFNFLHKKGEIHTQYESKTNASDNSDETIQIIRSDLGSATFISEVICANLPDEQLQNILIAAVSGEKFEDHLDKLKQEALECLSTE